MSVSAPDFAVRALSNELHTALPAGSTPLERALVKAITGLPRPVVIEQINDYEKVDARLLNIVAYGLNVDAWSSSWPESIKRAALKTAREIQSKKGTVWAVREVLKALGQGDAEIIERIGAQRWDGGAKFDEKFIWGGEQNGWATFAIRLKQPVSETQGRLIIDAVSAVKRASAHLIYVDWSAAQLRWDELRRWDSGYTFDLISA